MRARNELPLADWTARQRCRRRAAFARGQVDRSWVWNSDNPDQKQRMSALITRKNVRIASADRRETSGLRPGENVRMNQTSDAAAGPKPIFEPGKTSGSLGQILHEDRRTGRNVRINTKPLGKSQHRTGRNVGLQPEKTSGFKHRSPGKTSGLTGRNVRIAAKSAGGGGGQEKCQDRGVKLREFSSENSKFPAQAQRSSSRREKCQDCPSETAS